MKKYLLIMLLGFSSCSIKEECQFKLLKLSNNTVSVTSPYIDCHYQIGDTVEYDNARQLIIDQLKNK